MASGRFISNTLGDSERFSSLTDARHQVAYVLIVSWACPEGRFIADPVTMNGKLFTRLGWTPDLVKTALKELHKVGLIRLYNVDGKPYGVVEKFHQHNKIERKADGSPKREAASKLPAPPAEELRSNSAPTPQQPRSDAAETPVEVEVEVEVQVEENTSSPKATVGEKHQAFQDAWNTHRGTLPQARGINDTRKRQIDRLTRELGADALGLFTDAVRQVAREPYWLEKGYGIGNLLAGGKVLNWAEKYRSTSTARTTGIGTAPPRFREHDLVYRPSDKAQAEITQLLDPRTALMDNGETWDLTGCERWTN